MKTAKILISGASIAGPVAAFWLNRYGFDVTLVERSESIPRGGQNIDVTGPAAEVVQKMGIADEIRRANTRERGLQFIDRENKVIAGFARGESLSITQDMEILRGDLVDILYSHTRDKVNYIFGTSIKTVDRHPSGLKVRYTNGQTDDFDLLIIAEGLGSLSRDKLFGQAVKFHYLGLYNAYFTLPRTASDNEWARWCSLPGGVMFLLRPDNHGTARASINFKAKEDEYTNTSLDDQKKILIEKIKGKSLESERLASGILNANDLYFERVSQVKMASWTDGPVALLGDSAWCVSPIAGKGTTLAITGAYVLAGELHKCANYSQALKRYEEIMRPYVHDSQDLPPGIPGIVYPDTSWGIKILNTLLFIAGSRPVKFVSSLLKRKKKSQKQAFNLPAY